MFNPQLTAFVYAADCGSFAKAAERLFISPTAVMKQINALEQHLDIKLLERTPKGVSLTPGGKVIYQDAKFLFEYSRRSIEKAGLAMKEKEAIFRGGDVSAESREAFHGSVVSGQQRRILGR